MNRWWVCAAILGLTVTQAARTFAASAEDPWKALSFLEGTWAARVTAGSAGAQASGTYTFKMELDHHVLARHSEPAACKGPDTFDCKHGDLLYIYREDDQQPPRALYLDSEGHVIHYTVSVPAPDTAEFNSDPNSPGPQFKLVYHLLNGVMSGKFQIRMPPNAEWKSYLEWSGARL